MSHDCEHMKEIVHCAPCHLLGYRMDGLSVLSLPLCVSFLIMRKWWPERDGSGAKNIVSPMITAAAPGDWMPSSVPSRLLHSLMHTNGWPGIPRLFFKNKNLFQKENSSEEKSFCCGPILMSALIVREFDLQCLHVCGHPCLHA